MRLLVESNKRDSFGWPKIATSSRLIVIRKMTVLGIMNTEETALDKFNQQLKAENGLFALTIDIN